MKLTGRALEAKLQREARAKALETGGDVRGAVKAAVAPMVPVEGHEPLLGSVDRVRVVSGAAADLAGFDKRAWQREYMRTVYRPRKRRVREMVPGDIGLADWPR